MNKKGVVFTFIVVTLLSIVLIAFLVNVSSKNNQIKIQNNNVKIETLNEFGKILDDQLLPQALKSSSNKVVLAWLQYLDETNVGINPNEEVFFNSDLNENLKEGILFERYNPGSGFVQLNAMSEYDKKNVLINYTLSSILEEVQELGTRSGINFSYADINNFVFEIGGYSPFELQVNMTIPDYHVSSFDKEIFWNFEDRKFSVLLNITNYRDPFMLVFNERNVTINQSSFDVNNPDDLVFEKVYRGPEYLANNDAPSFLDRLQGSFNDNENGIETIVYLTLNSDVSYIDHYYWKLNKEGCLIQNHPIYLDSGHLYGYMKQDPNCAF